MFTTWVFLQRRAGLATQTSKQGFIVTAGNSTIYFQQATSGEPFYHFAFNIPCNKIEEAKDWLSQKLQLIWMDDYKSVVVDFVNWKARSVYFFDAAGNIVELIARFDLQNETEESFDAKHFLSVSEIGLVFPQREIENDTAALLHNYSLKYFDKQPPFPNFKAVGDDEGLFIIVTTNRNWYPPAKHRLFIPWKSALNKRA